MCVSVCVCVCVCVCVFVCFLIEVNGIQEKQLGSLHQNVVNA